MADPSGSIAATIVTEKYAQSVALANAANAQIEGLQEALTDSIYQPPTIDVKWESLAAPTLPPIPDLPPLPDMALAAFDAAPTAFSDTVPDVQVDGDAPVAPALNFGIAPTLTIGQAPVLPAVRDVALPDAPVVVLPDAPQFLALQTHTFGGVNLHEDWLDKLDEIPELSILQPAPFNYQPGAKYASQLLDNLKAVLNARIQGGTGLAPTVEQQIWDRARDRETQLALAREQDALRAAESLGFPLPSGVLAGQIADARREYLDKLSGLSRDIAIKQADLEQQNLRDAIGQALQLESSLMEDCYKLELLAFEASKSAAENAIAAHNAALEHFKALLAGYQAYAAAYDTVIKAELSKIEVFKALLQAEQTKADINKSLVDRYKAEIEGCMAAVEIYKARVGAAQTLVELERTRIQAGGEQVKAFVATVNAETAKAEMYKAQVGAESAKSDAYRSATQAYGAKVGAQVEVARLGLSKVQIRLEAKRLEWDGWRAKVDANARRVESAARQSSIIVDGYRIGANASEAQAGSYMRRWEADIRQYQAAQSLTFDVARTNAAAVTHANDARMEAAKIGLATGAQRVATAWNMVGVSAQVSDNTNLGISG